MMQGSRRWGVQQLLCCPTCKHELEAPAGANGAPDSGSEQCGFACARCEREYPVIDSVLDFFPEGQERSSGAQRLMEFEPIVAIYESTWWRDSKLFARATKISLADEIALIERMTALGPADTVLDLACGPGLYTRPFATGGPKRDIIGLDLSWPMLRYATKKARALGIGNITFLHGDAHALPFMTASIDAANCCGALHLFPDVPRVLRELGRAVKPGGRLATAVFFQHESDDGPWPRRLFDAKMGVHRFRESELKELIDAAGFDPSVHHAAGMWMIAGGVRRG